MRASNFFSNKGFTLLEVLIAIVILAIGLLGLATLQAVGLQTNQSALHRTQATNLAYDMVDRIRSNRANIADYALVMDATAPLDCTTNLALSQATQAARDLAAWQNSVGCSLPQPNASIDVDADNNQVTITVQWDDTRGQDAEPLAFIVESQI